MNAPLVPVTLAFLLGIVLAAQGLAVGPVGCCAAMSAVAALLSHRRARAGLAALLLLWVCLGALWMCLWSAHPDARLADVLLDEPEVVQLHGIVREDPVEPFTPRDEADEPTAATARGARMTCVVELRHVRTPEGWRPLQGLVRASLTPFQPRLGYGDEMLLEGVWSGVPPPGNPGQYNWRASLARQRIHGLLRCRPADGLVILGRHRGHPVLAAAFVLRARWASLLRSTFSERDAGLLRSFLLGQRVALDERLNTAFVETGTIHLLVVSGFNVGLVAVLLELLFRWFGIPWRLRLIMSALGLGVYAIVTGLQPPVVRAMIMAWVVLGALALDRVVAWYNALAAAALAICWINPTQLFDPGFQLSFGAVWSLLAFSGRWFAWLEPQMSWVRPAGARRYVAGSLSATTAIWVGLSPVLAWYFHLVSPVSMLANLLIAPLVSLLVSAGTAALLAATMIGGVLRVCHMPLAILLEAIVRCVNWCQAIPGGHAFVPHPWRGLLVGYYGLLGLSLLRRRWHWTMNRVLVCWVFGITLWLWSLVASHALACRWLRVDVLDVGHGDSMVIHTPRGQRIVVDTGTREAGQYRVVPFLRFEGATALDALVLTHTDEDHIGGAAAILRACRISWLLTNGVQGDTMSTRRVRRLAADRGIRQRVLTAGMMIGDDPDVEIAVLHPPRGLVPGSPPVSNDNSIVLKLTKGSVSVLLFADIDEAGLPWLIRQGAAIRATVLKVPHHGSRLGAAGNQLFDAVQPRIALLSVGRLHHLPAPETVEALRRRGITLYSTRTDGAIRLRTDGRQLEVRTFRQ